MNRESNWLQSLLSIGSGSTSAEDKKQATQYYTKSTDGEIVPVDLPEAEGTWMDTAKLGLNVADIGTGIFNAYSQYRNNKFLKKYYENQMDLQRADFANNARSTNEALQSRKAVRVSAHDGLNPYQGEGQRKVADYMKKWGVSEAY